VEKSGEVSTGGVVARAVVLCVSVTVKCVFVWAAVERSDL
jgi:hypothetical protein